MGSSDNFCLRWNDFESNISTSFRELRDDNEFFDVTLCCDNGKDLIQAHKVILAACSPLFRTILSHQKHQQNPLLYLKGIRLKELQAVLNFMYHGEVNVAQDSLNNFLAVAEELAVKGLTTDSKPSNNAPDSERKKAVAKRKSVPQNPAPNASGAKKAKSDDEDESLDIKRIKAEPEPSGSGQQASGASMVEEMGDDSYAGDDGADDFGDGEDFEGFAQYGDGQEFDDSLAGASGSGAGADGKDFCFVEVDVTTKATRKTLTLREKVRLIEDSMKPGFSQDKAAKEYGISQSAVSKILKNKFNIYCNSASPSNTKKNLTRGKNDALEEKLYEWYLHRKTAGLPISGPLLRSKAEELANSFTCSAEAGFKFSNGWLDGFKRRYDIRFTNIIYKKRESKKSGSIKSEPLDPTTGHFLA